MTNSHRFPLLAAGLFGVTGVALGAFGAHGLAAVLAERGTAQAWETAARYQLLHAVALLATAAWLRAGAGAGTARMIWAAHCWSAGIVLFSGSLYGFAVGGPHFLVYLTPVGGVTLMAGWALVVAAAFVMKDE